MPQPLLLQSRFTRSEFKCVVKSLGDADVCERDTSIGENMAIRQSLEHTHPPQFVGDIDGKAPYRPERLQRGKWEVA